MADANDIRRKKLRCIVIKTENAETIRAEGEFGVNTLLFVALERRKVKPFVPAIGKDAVLSEEEKEYRKIWWELKNYWQAQEGKTYSQLEKIIQEKTGNKEPEFLKLFEV